MIQEVDKAQAELERNEVLRKHKEYIFPCVTNYYAQPLVAYHARAQYVWDIEGKRYLDFFGGILTISVGHCNPKVTTKIKEQVDRLQHSSTLYPNEQIVALAEKLAQITPGRLQKSFFCNSGTEADETAVMLARMSTGHFDVVALRHGYSGH
jgi:alanine-glyoxylate transaminase/(R)-3-amino-2-methylpropionate-pyruvate transaminase